MVAQCGTVFDATSLPIHEALDTATLRVREGVAIHQSLKLTTYFPALPNITFEFSNTIALTQMTLTLWFFGACNPIIYWIYL